MATRKTRKRKPTKFREADAPANTPATAGGGEPPPAAHDDAAQDAELFKKLIGEHLGAEHVDNPEVNALAKEAYESYCEMGYSQEDAMQATGHALKLAKHKSAKDAETNKETGQDPTADQGDKSTSSGEDPAAGGNVVAHEAGAAAAREAAAVPGNNPASQPAGDQPPPSSLKEAHQEIARLRGRVVFLEREAAGRTITTHLEKVCKESKLPVKATDAFRALESVKRARTTKEIDEIFKSFRIGFTEGGEGSSSSTGETAQRGGGFDSFIVHPETSRGAPSEGSSDGFSSFARN